MAIRELKPSNVGSVDTDQRGSVVVGATGRAQLAIEQLAAADPANVQEIAASSAQLLNLYHEQVLAQAQQSFRWALIAAAVGLLFFLFAIAFVLTQQALEVAAISAICGALVQFISAINFYLYGKTAAQMAEFQQRLERTQRFLIANSLCEGLEGDPKQRARSQLIQTMTGSRLDTPTNSNSQEE